MNNEGQTLIIALVVIGFLTLYTLMLTNVVVQTSQVSRLSERQESALWLAEAGIENALWCMNNNEPFSCGGSAGDLYVGETDVPLGDGTFTTDLAYDDITAEITSTGTIDDAVHTIKSTIAKEAGTTSIVFPAAAVAGDGGIYIDHGDVTGGIYSNGDVSCYSGTSFTSDVIIAGTEELNDCAVYGTVKAHKIEDSYISGDAYYTILDDSTVDGVLYPGSPDQPEVEFLLSDAVIDRWKAAATEGGEIDPGEPHYHPVDGETLGPVKIIGDLHVKSGRLVTMSGTIYATGKIDVDKNAGFQLHPDFTINSGIIISDQRMDFDSQANFLGTAEGGVITMVTMSDSDSAIDVRSAAAHTHLVLYAPNGRVRLRSGSKIKGVMADRIHLEPGSEIDHAGGLLTVSVSNLSNVPTYWEERAGLRY